MPDKLTVVSTGAPVPFERDPRRTIGAEPTEVPATAYYRRRLAHGELRRAEATKPAKTSAAAAPAAPAGKGN